MRERDDPRALEPLPDEAEWFFVPSVPLQPAALRWLESRFSDKAETAAVTLSCIAGDIAYRRTEATYTPSQQREALFGVLKRVDALLAAKLSEDSERVEAAFKDLQDWRMRSRDALRSRLFEAMLYGRKTPRANPNELDSWDKVAIMLEHSFPHIEYLSIATLRTIRQRLENFCDAVREGKIKLRRALGPDRVNNDALWRIERMFKRLCGDQWRPTGCGSDERHEHGEQTGELVFSSDFVTAIDHVLRALGDDPPSSRSWANQYLDLHKDRLR